MNENEIAGLKNHQIYALLYLNKHVKIDQM